LVRGWIEAARDDRLLVAHVERDAARWTSSGDSAELWRKGRLASAIELWNRDPAQLSKPARQFITASAKEEQKAQRARLTAVLLVVGLLVGGALFYAKLSKDSATQARRDADALSAALAQVKALKQQAEEAAGEAAAAASILHDLQKKMAQDQVAYEANVEQLVKKIATAKSLDTAQRATADLKTRPPAPSQVVPLPMSLLGASGPSIPKPGDAAPSLGGGGFDQSAVERVVNSRKAAVKRVCIERSAMTTGTTKVTATITIAPNGSVQNVSTASDEPVVAKCIEQQLRGWSFPAPGDVKEVQIPFVFVRQ
jgi:hypothetical protein